MKKRYITLLTVVFTAMASMAQVINDTINRMVLVESTYNPIIAGAVKRNFIPEEVIKSWKISRRLIYLIWIRF